MIANYRAAVILRNNPQSIINRMGTALRTDVRGKSNAVVGKRIGIRSLAHSCRRAFAPISVAGNAGRKSL